jgi:hypothetical protein
MRGGDERSGALFSYVDLEARVGKDHPLRTERAMMAQGIEMIGAGEGNRTLVFSLEVSCAVNSCNAHSDKSGVFGPLTALRFSSLSEPLEAQP